MEYIWKWTFFSKLPKISKSHSFDVRNHPCLMTERYQTPHRDRCKMLEILFESFDIPSLYLSHAANLAVYGSGSYEILLTTE